MSIVKQCKSLGLRKIIYYCKPKGESSLNQLLMKAIGILNVHFMAHEGLLIST
jgi:hypothetical protein